MTEIDAAELARVREALKAAAIVARTTPLQTDPRGWYSDGFKDARNYIADQLDDIIRPLFASPAPDPAEAMRAKCSEFARGTKYAHPADRLEEGWNAACDEIADAIAALKGNGEGL